MLTIIFTMIRKCLRNLFQKKTSIVLKVRMYSDFVNEIKDADILKIIIDKTKKIKTFC